MQTLHEFIENNQEAIHARCEANTRRNSSGQIVLPIDDEWRDEDVWDDLYEEVKRKHEDSAR